jgi:hypothetical protein
MVQRSKPKTPEVTNIVEVTQGVLVCPVIGKTPIILNRMS